jgi:micrococcal nuclease
MIFLRTAFLIFFCFSCSNDPKSTTDLREITGKVIGVKDGDTIEVLFNGQPLTVRLEHIDCPELRKSQPFAKAAKQFTSAMCFGQVVTIINQKRYDRYKRLIGVVINTHGQNINKELLKAGLAWHFKKYSTDKAYADLQEYARLKQVGLWKERSPVAPWDWRNKKDNRQLN